MGIVLWTLAAVLAITGMVCVVGPYGQERATPGSHQPTGTTDELAADR
jgi:hypothetical protein